MLRIFPLFHVTVTVFVGRAWSTTVVMTSPCLNADTGWADLSLQARCLAVIYYNLARNSTACALWKVCTCKILTSCHHHAPSSALHRHSIEATCPKGPAWQSVPHWWYQGSYCGCWYWPATAPVMTCLFNDVIIHALVMMLWSSIFMAFLTQP